MKGYKDGDVQVLADHVLRQKTSMADSFLTSETGEEARSMLKRKAADSEGSEAKEGCEIKPVQPQRKRANTFDIDRDTPRYHNVMDVELEKLQNKFDAVEQSFTKGHEQLQEIPEETKLADIALQGYVRKLQFRYQLYLKWRGMDTVVKLHNTHVPDGATGAGSGTRSASAFPGIGSAQGDGEMLMSPAPL